jgi:hypothetical protein
MIGLALRLRSVWNSVHALARPKQAAAKAASQSNPA